MPDSVQVVPPNQIEAMQMATVTAMAMAMMMIWNTVFTPG
jgi:hypothetical protein